MNEVTVFQTGNLPDTIEDLTQFVLVGKAKLDAYMLKLRTVNRLSTAQEIRDQTLKEAQEVSTALIAAEQRIGEILLAIPKQAGGDRKSEDFKNRDVSNFEKTKTETISDMGYTKDEASDYQRMAQNPEIVKKVLDKAIENGDVATKSQVMKEIAEEKKRAKALEEENRKLREAISSQGTENVRLKMELEKAPAKEIVKEVTVEVMPDDYEALKSQAKNADIYQKDFRRMQSEYEKMSEKWKRAEEEKDRLQKKLNEPEEKMAYDSRLRCFSMCSAVKTFLDKYGGMKFNKREIDALPKREREDFNSAIKEMRKWIDEVLDEVTLEV